MGRGSKTQLQMGENLNDFIPRLVKHYKRAMWGMNILPNLHFKCKSDSVCVAGIFSIIIL